MAEIDVESIFHYAMKGQFREVLKAYNENHGALEAKITKAQDTVLHLAVYFGQTRFVRKVLDGINEEVCLNVLHMRNSKGNTTLHLAAEVGNVGMCYNMAKRDSKLIWGRNNEGETPLFLAALHGKKEAFLCLHSLKQNHDDEEDSLVRNSNGDTILHSAISSEYFG